MNIDNIYEEEQYFPYIDITLEESRIIRYLISNIIPFKNGKIVQMSLKKLDEYIYANGLFNSDISSKENKSFESYIYQNTNGYMIYTIICDILSQKDYYSKDIFNFKKDDIQVINKLEKNESSSYKLNYPKEKLLRK